MIRTYLTFKSDVADEAEWGPGDELVAPDGKKHSLILAQALARDAQAGEPWNEEDYGWEFLCEVDSFSVSVLIQPDCPPSERDEPSTYWLVIIQSVLGWFRRKRREQALEKVRQMLDTFVKSDARFHDARWWTAEEYVGRACKPHA